VTTSGDPRESIDDAQCKREVRAIAARGPTDGDGDEQAEFDARVVAEPVVVSAKELDDILASIARFLLDFCTAPRRGMRAPPIRANGRPDGGRYEDLPPPLHEVAA
jgi:hypothetical protein